MNIVETPSKKDQVRNYLIQELNSGKYPPGSMFLSENMLFRELGICKNTVREALSSLVSEGLLERVRGKGTFVLEPRPHIVESTSAGVVHFICANPWRTGESDPFISGLVQGLHAALDPFRWRICLDFADFTEHSHEDMKTIISTIHPGECAVLAGFNFSAELTGMLREANIRFLTVGQAEDESVPCVDTDYVSGTYDAVCDLIGRGHTRIALVDRRGPHFPSCEKRRRGYIKALGEHGIIPDARLMAQYSNLTPAEGEKVWKELEEYATGFTAVLIYGDVPVLGFVKSALAVGRKIPEGLSVVAFCDPPLLVADHVITRIVPSLIELGKAAGNLIREPNGTFPRTIACRRLEGNTVAGIGQ